MGLLHGIDNLREGRVILIMRHGPEDRTFPILGEFKCLENRIVTPRKKRNPPRNPRHRPPAEPEKGIVLRGDSVKLGLPVRIGQGYIPNTTKTSKDFYSYRQIRDAAWDQEKMFGLLADSGELYLGVYGPIVQSILQQKA